MIAIDRRRRRYRAFHVEEEQVGEEIDELSDFFYDENGEEGGEGVVLKLPLTLWFAAIHLIVTAKNGILSVELGRRLGVKQPTAWAVKHKIMAVMARREGETRLAGRVWQILTLSDRRA